MRNKKTAHIKHYWIDYPLRSIEFKYRGEKSAARAIKSKINRIKKFLKLNNQELAHVNIDIHFQPYAYESVEEISERVKNNKIYYFDCFLDKLTKYKRFKYLPFSYEEYKTVKNYQERSKSRKNKVSIKKT